VLRPITPADTEPIVQLTEATGFFQPIEIVALREVLEDFHAGNRVEDHAAICWTTDAAIRGFAYYAPDSMTVGTWYLYWIAVATQDQRRGVGATLLRRVEENIRAQHGRQIFIETSSQPIYEPTRRFYEKHGYGRAAVLKDYYRVGDDLVVFCKRLDGEKHAAASRK